MTAEEKTEVSRQRRWQLRNREKERQRKRAWYQTDKGRQSKRHEYHKKVKKYFFACSYCRMNLKGGEPIAKRKHV